MQIGLDEHMLLSQIWQYKLTSGVKYKAVEKKTSIGIVEKEKGKNQSEFIWQLHSIMVRFIFPLK